MIRSNGARAERLQHVRAAVTLASPRSPRTRGSAAASARISSSSSTTSTRAAAPAVVSLTHGDTRLDGRPDAHAPERSKARATSRLRVLRQPGAHPDHVGLHPLERPHADPEDAGRRPLVAPDLVEDAADVLDSPPRPATGRTPSSLLEPGVNSIRRSSRVMTRPLASVAARSTTFSSSRTLPGQLCSWSHLSASSSKPSSSLPIPPAARFRKCSARSGMSSGRSRRLGIRIGMTASR